MKLFGVVLKLSII